VGVVGLRLTYLHMDSLGMKLMQLLMVFMVWFWKSFVEFLVVDWKLFLSMESRIFELYCWFGSITMELPLSALVVVVSFSCEFCLNRFDSYLFGKEVVWWV
jgi:hypothetical protein